MDIPSELTPVEREYLERTRKASGVPAKVTDPATIRMIAAMLTRPSSTNRAHLRGEAP